MVAQIDTLIRDSAARRAKILAQLSVVADRSVLQLNDTTTVFVVDADGSKVVAFAAVLRYSANQAYCMIAEIDETIRPLTVHVTELADFDKWPADKDHVALKLTKMSDKQKDRRLLPIYVQAHVRPSGRLALEHVIDTVIEHSLGVDNLELKKNVTVDLYATDATAIWRDRAGFCVTDRNQYAELCIDRRATIDTLNAFVTECQPNIVISPIDNTNRAHLIEYDQTVSQLQRHDFIEYLTSLPNVYGVVAREAADEQRVVGYALATDGHVMCCYGESTAIAYALLINIFEQFSADTVTLNVRAGSSIADTLAAVSTETRRVYRYHTRAVPSQAKWDKVHVLNIGLHLI
jgi:hypothetical protein